MPKDKVSSQHSYDAVVVGSGPNGLAAGIALAQKGVKTLIVEAKDSIGGGMRTQELTLPGYWHDVCSAVHPMAAMSPFMRALPLQDFGLEWVHPEVMLAHPLDGGRAAALWRDLGQTAEALGGRDGKRWRSLFAPHLPIAEALFKDLLGPLPLLPRHPIALARFGLGAMRSATGFARGNFESEEARALFAGNAAHSVLPLENAFTAAVTLALTLAGHSGGWPVAKGGSRSIAQAMASYFESLGGKIECNVEMRDVRDFAGAKAILFDTGPHAMARIAQARLPEGYRKRLLKFRYGPGVFKLDLAVSGPIPWTNELCRKAGTVHVGGTLEEIAHSERANAEGKIAEKPFVLLAQQSVCDPTRAPAGKHTVWAYAHVPGGSTEDVTERILGQIERFAPGFRDTILAKKAMNTQDFQAYNANNVGGDVIGGVMDLAQLFTRPVARWNPYTTPDKGIYICSSSTPPGGGVHGMSGYYAAQAALKHHFR
jgi:phytoene dehydrogenase-like protein